MARDELDVYWGVASGRSHAMFRRHYEGEGAYQDAPRPTHLMVNWRTATNEVWEGPAWMVDSGGAPQTIQAHGGHPDTIHDYIEYLRDPPTRYGDDIADVHIEQFALRDWPCEPSVQSSLGLSVEQLQHRTLVDHINMMDALERENIEAEPVAVLQGWNVHDYLDAIDMYRDHGLITDRMAIGTLCGRDQVDVIRNAVWRISRNLPSRVSLHGFGVKQTALGAPDVLRIFDSVDTAAWDIALRQATKDGVELGPPGGEYDDWVEWDDGNPRMTARNAWVNYRGYAERLARVEPVDTPHNVRVVTLDQMYDVAGEERPAGQRVDEYVVLECLCGQIIDPGQPDPVGEPRCRHCERVELDILLRRIDLEDHLGVVGASFEERVETEARKAVFEQMDLIDGDNT